MNKGLRQKGWSDMSQQLDTHLPRRRRRLVGLWWLWTLSFLAVAAAIWWSLRDQPDQSAAQIASATLSEESELQPQTFPIATNSESRSEAIPKREDLVPSRANSSASTLRTSKVKRERFSAAVVPSSNNEKESETRVSLKTEEFESPKEGISEDQSFSPEALLAKSELSPITDRIPTAEIRTFASSLPSLQVPGFSSPALIRPNNLKSNALFVDLSSGLRMVAPHSYVAQLGLGWRNQVNEKLSYDLTIGGGVEGFHQEATTELKEIETRSMRQDSEFGQGPNAVFNADGSYGQASFQLRQSYFSYLGAAANYSFAPRWSVTFGLDLIYRVYNSYKGYYQIEGGGTDLSGEEFQFTSRMINDQFQVFNRWDLRTNLGVGYDIQSHMRLYLSYRHGFSSVLAHPSENTPAGRARFLALGCQYTF